MDGRPGRIPNPLAIRYCAPFIFCDVRLNWLDTKTFGDPRDLEFP